MSDNDDGGEVEEGEGLEMVVVDTEGGGNDMF